jgi:hypothetical protein
MGYVACMGKSCYCRRSSKANDFTLLGTYPGDNNLIGAVAVIQTRPVEQSQVACQEARFECLHTLRGKASSRSLRSSLYQCEIFKLLCDTDSEDMSDEKEKHLTCVLTCKVSSAQPQHTLTLLTLTCSPAVQYVKNVHRVQSVLDYHERSRGYIHHWLF